MDITKASILHHIGIVLLLLSLLVSCGWTNPLIFFACFVYLYLINETYSVRLRRRVEFEERRSAYQQRVLSDSESVRWLNHALDKIWPVCVEQIAVQKFLLPIIPWFLEKYKPWPANKIVVQKLYLGRNPPVFTTIRVLGESTGDDDLVLELGMNFVSADDMSGILAIQLRKRLGLGVWTKMHLLGMHVEGKVLVGVKFLKEFPFLGQVRVCFVEPPYFTMTVKPLFSHGVDVTELPGIAGWIEGMLDAAFEQTLVEPNMLVIDMEKFVSSTDGWFNIDEKRPVAFVRVEILEGADMNPSDRNGLADPYVKGQIGAYRFQTKVQKKTLNPKWQEEFKIPVTSWNAQNVLVMEVRDKDRLSSDDMLGNCSIDISELGGGERHDKWLPLKNIKKGRLRIAVTVVESENSKMEQWENREESPGVPDRGTPKSSSPDRIYSEVDAKQGANPKMDDHYEPINFEGQEMTSMWVHHPGSEASPTWEPRKGHDRHSETRVQGEEENISSPSRSSVSSESDNTDIDRNIDDEEQHKVRKLKTVKKGIKKIGSLLRKNRKSRGPGGVDSPTNTSPREVAGKTNYKLPPQIQGDGNKLKKVKIIMDDGTSSFIEPDINLEKDEVEKTSPDSDESNDEAELPNSSASVEANTHPKINEQSSDIGKNIQESSDVNASGVNQSTRANEAAGDAGSPSLRTSEEK